MDAPLIARVEAIARREGKSLDQMLERFICQRLRKEAENWKADNE
jgi:cytidylate kinase